ncbi:MAG: type I DNA topoisomerase [Patescibacteria group bacterium]
MQLVIVESPTKAKTISKFLGSDFIVRSSYGHVRDLPKSKIGVDTEKNFKPTYTVPTKAKQAVADLKDAMKHATEVILASDEDREGEAIAWHLSETLDLKKPKRIVFHEITKTAIQEALKHPRELDMNLVDAQQARRILDRLVGYELSPFLWRKVRFGLSAGRVQSVAVRIVVEREREIQKFNKEEYWSIEADLAKNGEQKTFRAKLIQIGDKKLDKFAVTNEAEAKKIIQTLHDSRYTIRDITKKEVQRNPSPPFITSTLQQEASRKLGWSAKQTMMAAQKLYETGLITYMRTDSLNLAESAIAEAASVVGEHFGKEYSNPRRYTTKDKGAQEAHEAIRPTSFAVQSKDRLYELIWKRAIASQMAPAVMDQTSVDIEAGQHLFRATGSVVKFDGFIRAYTEGKDEEEDEVEGQLPELSKNEVLDLKKLEPLQHFTEPPPRYTDATLVKALESHGIGRPSTYAPTLTTIQDRGYVEKIEKKYHPTEIGFLVNDMLVEHFPQIVDINFTSHVEAELDHIAEGKVKWVPVVAEFYNPFHTHLKEKEKEVEKVVQESTTKCEHCGKMMLIKFGRMGKFLACPDPESKITQPMPEEQAQINALSEKTKGEKCPICGKDMEIKRGRFGFFLGCMDYPKCKGITKILNKIGFKCPNCQIGELVERKSRGRGQIFYGCARYPDCNFLMSKKPESEADLAPALQHWKDNPPKPKKEWKKKA